jgi:hypothetical protein
MWKEAQKARATVFSVGKASFLNSDSTGELVARKERAL